MVDIEQTLLLIILGYQDHCDIGGTVTESQILLSSNRLVQKDIITFLVCTDVPGHLAKSTI